MKLKHIFYIIVPFIICGCGTTSVVPHKNADITITADGIEAIGVGVSKIEKASNSIAIRLARANLIEYLNIALANVDKELEFTTIMHTEDKLQNSKIIDTAQYSQKGDFSTVARIGITFDEIYKWISLYYDNLPAEDKLKTQISKDEFTRLMYKHLKINP